MKLERQAIVERLSALFPGCKALVKPKRPPCLKVPVLDLLAVASTVRNDPALRFDSLMDLAGLDTLRYAGAKKSEFPYRDLVVAYQLHSLEHRHHLTLKVCLPREQPELPTVQGIWPVAEAFEREVWDLFGVVFTGHQRLKRILTPDDWVGHPLRKDYVYPTVYNGIAMKREGQHFEDGPYA